MYYFNSVIIRRVIEHGENSIKWQNECVRNPQTWNLRKVGKWLGMGRGCSVMLEKGIGKKFTQTFTCGRGRHAWLSCSPSIFSKFSVTLGGKDKSLTFPGEKHQGQSVLSQVNGCIYSFSMDGASSILF